MKTCPQCQQPNSDDARFCSNCGYSALPVTNAPPPIAPKKKNSLTIILIVLGAIIGSCVICGGIGAIRDKNKVGSNLGVITTTPTNTPFVAKTNTPETTQVDTSPTPPYLVSSPSPITSPTPANFKSAPKAKVSENSDSSSSYTVPKHSRKTAESPEINSSGASAKCADGTLSYSAHRRGTCSRHGGVAEWY